MRWLRPFLLSTLLLAAAPAMAQARIIGNRAGRALGLAMLLALTSVQLHAQAPGGTKATSALDRGMQAAASGDMALAAGYFRTAAEAGDALAQFNLGRLHEAGAGVPRDGAEAARFHRMAADQGFAPAQAALARMLWRGTAVPMNPREAMRLARAAADQGEPEGFAVLGILYFNGQGTPRNMIEAWYWLSLVERHHPDPQQRAWAEASRRRAANSLSLEQIAATRQRVEAYRMPVAR